MSRRAASQNILDEQPQVNLTPLIDVVFVVLIMFIVIAPMLELEQVALAKAGEKGLEQLTELRESSPISLYVKANNTVWFNKEPVALGSLTEKLKEAKAAYPKARPQIFHDEQAYFGTYQRVKNAVEAAGFEEMDLVLHPAATGE